MSFALRINTFATFLQIENICKDNNNESSYIFLYKKIRETVLRKDILNLYIILHFSNADTFACLLQFIKNYTYT